MFVLSLEILFDFEVCGFDFLFGGGRMEVGGGFGGVYRFAVGAGVDFEDFVEGIGAYRLWLLYHRLLFHHFR